MTEAHDRATRRVRDAIIAFAVSLMSRILTAFARTAELESFYLHSYDMETMQCYEPRCYEKSTTTVNGIPYCSIHGTLARRLEEDLRNS